MDDKLWGGVDPGGSGAVVIVSSNAVVDTIRFETSTHDILKFLENYAGGLDFVILEKVHNINRGRKQGASSMFKFGWQYGRAETLLVAAQVRFETRTPQQWQAGMHISYDKDWTDTQKKNHTKSAAIRLWPSFPFTHHESDAALIAEYCRRWRTGQL